jgi:hypothetical protein
MPRRGTVAAYRCATCATEVTIEAVHPFRCPAATLGDSHHVLHPVVVGPDPKPIEDPNPFVSYGRSLAWWAFARSHGMSEDDCIALTREVADGFHVTPGGPHDEVSLRVGAQVWVKDETGNVGGSHKARHLVGILLHLRAAEAVGLAPGPRPPLAIASCGNAAIAAATLAQRAGWPLQVFVPDTVSDSVAALLDGLGAQVNRCPRSPDLPPGDPAVLAFRAAVQDLGGGYVGVGPDQAYLFIGWQRPEFAWLIDYDPKVMRVHAMYRALLQAFERRRDFLAAFESEQADATSALLQQQGDPRLRRLYRNNRDMFRWRLRTLERKLGRRGVPCWLTDDETYAYVRAMVLGDRVRPLRVNLVDDVGMAGIAEAARALGVTVRVVYLSNAEEYWERYEPQFVANLAALPIDDRALVLRTRLVWQVNRDYVYNAQSLAEYLAWLQTPGVETLEDIVGRKPKAEAGRINFVHTTGLPPAAGS